MTPAFKQKLKSLQSNGHGCFFQQIYINVQKDYADHIEHTMGLKRLSEGEETVRFLWLHKSRRLGDDEGIVFELDVYSGIPLSTWTIDWDNSVY